MASGLEESRCCRRRVLKNALGEVFLRLEELAPQIGQLAVAALALGWVHVIRANARAICTLLGDPVCKRIDPIPFCLAAHGDLQVFSRLDGAPTAGLATMTPESGLPVRRSVGAGSTG